MWITRTRTEFIIFNNRKQKWSMNQEILLDFIDPDFLFSYLQHFVWGWFNTRSHVGRRECTLFNFREIVFRIFIKHHFSNRYKWVIFVKPYLLDINRINRNQKRTCGVYFAFSLSCILKKCLTLSCIMLHNGQTYFKNLAWWTPQDFKSMFGHFTTLYMKGLTHFNPMFYFCSLWKLWFSDVSRRYRNGILG